MKLSEIRLTTCEIVPSLEFSQALLRQQVQDGHFNYPCYSIQGQMVDIVSKNLSIPIDASGRRIEMTDITFQNIGEKPILLATAAGTIANETALTLSNDIILEDSKQSTASHLIGGSKSF